MKILEETEEPAKANIDIIAISKPASPTRFITKAFLGCFSIVDFMIPKANQQIRS